jgi:hypothetical protein
MIPSMKRKETMGTFAKERKRTHHQDDKSMSRPILPHNSPEKAVLSKKPALSSSAATKRAWRDLGISLTL